MRSIDYQKCGKYLSYLFWLLIPNIVAGILTNEKAGGQVRALFIIGTVINIVCMIAYAYFLWQMQTEEPLYRTAAIVSLASAVWSVITDLFVKTTSVGLSIVFGIIGLIIAVAQIYFLYEAHSSILEEIDPELSGKWLTLRKRYFLAIGLIALGLILVFLPMLAVLCALAGGIMTIVIGIIELVYLYRSANVCKNQQYEL